MILALLLQAPLVEAKQIDPAGQVQMLDEVIVTARRTETPVEDVPGSVEALDAAAVSQAGLFRASDLAGLSASLTERSIFGSSAPQFFIRGIGSNDVNPSANPGVAVYLDQGFIASPLAQNVALFDLSGAEILKGPQGTLFGRNATGGALIFKTRPPGTMPGLDLSAGVGSFGLQTYDVAADTGRLGPILARVAATYRKSDGYTDNTLTGGEENGIETFAIRLRADTDTAGPWSAGLILDYANDRSAMTAHEGLGLFAPEGFATPPPAGPVFIPCAPQRVLAGECLNLLGYRYSADPFSEGFDRESREHLDTGGAVLTLRREGPVEATSITSWRFADRDVREDTDASPLDLVALDFDNSSRVFTQEFLFGGRQGRFDWRAGAFGLDETLSTTNRFSTLGTLRAAGVGFIDDPFLFAFGPFRLAQTYTLDTRSVALFAETDFSATDRLFLTAGARVTRERTSFETETRFEEVTANPVLSPERSGEQTDDAISWRLAARYELAPHRVAYVSVNRGFKSGSFNGGALFPTDTIGPVAPEFVTAWEAGSTWRFTDSLAVNAAAFFYDYSDLQDFTLRATPPPARQVLDSADAEMKGVDVTLRAALPWNLNLRLSTSWLDATFTDFVDANGVDRSGNRLTASPELSAVAALSWQGSLGGDWTVGADLSANYRSAIFFDNTNDPLLQSNARTLVDAAITVGHTRSGVSATFAVRNLTDEVVVSDALPITNYGFIQRTFAPPRAFFFTVRSAFQ
jgi:iron complex outermembrane receptor protein